MWLVVYFEFRKLFKIVGCGVLGDYLYFWIKISRVDRFKLNLFLLWIKSLSVVLVPNLLSICCPNSNWEPWLKIMMPSTWLKLFRFMELCFCLNQSFGRLFLSQWLLKIYWRLFYGTLVFSETPLSEEPSFKVWGNIKMTKLLWKCWRGSIN